MSNEEERLARRPKVKRGAVRSSAAAMHEGFKQRYLSMVHAQLQVKAREFESADKDGRSAMLQKIIGAALGDLQFIGASNEQVADMLEAAAKKLRQPTRPRRAISAGEDNRHE